MDCEKYIEQISCLIDGELSAEDEAGLRAHLDACPDCRRVYDAFSAISDEDELVPAPEGLARGIMYSIENKNSSSRPRLFVFGRFTAIAACLALLIFGAARFGLFDMGKDSDADMAEMTLESADSYDADVPETSSSGFITKYNIDNFSNMDLALEQDEQVSSERVMLFGSYANKNCAAMNASDPATNAVRKLLENKFGAGPIKLYSGVIDSENRMFKVSGKREVDIIYMLLTCVHLQPNSPFDESEDEPDPDYTIVFSDDSTLTLWYIEENIYCRLSNDENYYALGQKTEFEACLNSMCKDD